VPESAQDVAVLLLTHVNYRTGAMHDMAALTAAAQRAGVLTVWDLAHSAGALPVDLTAAGADFAVGCGYKYLNGGPGAPAFVWVHPQHAERFWQPLAGWWGHAAPFAFTPDYKPAPGIGRYLCGTQPILSLSALACGLDTFSAAEPLGGMAALRQKSLALSDLFIELVAQRCAGQGLTLVTPSPTSTTMPAPSWPNTAGKMPSGSSPDRVKASVWHTPVWVILTSTSPFWGGATSISTICKGLPASKATAARDFMEKIPHKAQKDCWVSQLRCEKDCELKSV
jgi:hypothetical protein